MVYVAHLGPRGPVPVKGNIACVSRRRAGWWPCVNDLSLRAAKSIIDDDGGSGEVRAPKEHAQLRERLNQRGSTGERHAQASRIRRANMAEGRRAPVAH